MSESHCGNVNCGHEQGSHVYRRLHGSRPMRPCTAMTPKGRCSCPDFQKPKIKRESGGEKTEATFY